MLEEARSGRLQQHPPGDTEEPGSDLRVASKADRRSAGADERLLRELLRVVAVADDAVEVREHGLLMGPEDIFKLHLFRSR